MILPNVNLPGIDREKRLGEWPCCWKWRWARIDLAYIACRGGGCLPFLHLGINQNSYQQFLSAHPQVGSVPAKIPARTPAAQPTPARTVIAPISQFLAQAPHSIQAPRSAIIARLFSIRNTACGQTITHMAHPLHFSARNSKVTASSRYLILLILYLQTNR